MVNLKNKYMLLLNTCIYTHETSGSKSFFDNQKIDLSCFLCKFYTKNMY